jgi:hypothetical protein
LVSAHLDRTWTLLTSSFPQTENLHHYNREANNIILTTVYDSGSWIAVAYKESGYPICSTKGGDRTVVDALRNMLKHTSERIALSAFVDEFLNQVDAHETETSAGIEYTVSRA